MDAQYLGKFRELMKFHTPHDAKNSEQTSAFSFMHQLFTLLVNLPPKKDI